MTKTSTGLALAALAAAAIALPAQAGPNVSVSIGINAPGQYGRIDINNYPQPVLVQQQPIIYAPTAYAVHQQPIYLYVPQVHQANWGRYCGNYRACGQPVYFVKEQWVREEYSREHDRGRGNGRHDNGNGRGDEGNGRGDKHGRGNKHRD